jgi:cytochrome c-type biogenesis protein
MDGFLSCVAMEALVVAYGAGLASAASPCLIPLYPAFLAYLTGSAGAEQGTTRARGVSGFMGLAVLLGLLTSMMLIGLVVVAISAPMGQILGISIPVIDAILITLGVMLLAGFNPFLKVPSIRVPGTRGPVSQAYIYGMFLGPIALPCAGPFLIALLAISVGAAETIGTLATFFVFGLGFGLPLVLLSVLARARQDTVVRFLARHHRAIEVVSGVLLIGAGTFDLWVNWEAILLTFGL